MNKITYDAIKKNTDTSSRTTLAMFLPQYNKLKVDLETLNIGAVLDDISQLSNDINIIIENLKEQSSELRTEAADDKINTGWLDVVDRILDNASTDAEQLDDEIVKPKGCGECDECQVAETVDCNETGCDTIIDACGVAQADPCINGEATPEPEPEPDEPISCESCDTGCDVCDASETSGCVVDSYVCEDCDAGCQLNDAGEICDGSDACGTGQGSCGGCDADNNLDCWSNNGTGNCYSSNESGTCWMNNESGSCFNRNNEGDCTTDNRAGNCDFSNETGTEQGCEMSNSSGNCQEANEAGDCSSNNMSGDCNINNGAGDCNASNEAGSCQSNNSNGTCDFEDDCSNAASECGAGQNTCGAADSCGASQLDCGESGCYSDAGCGGCDTDDSSCGGCFGCDSCEADDCGACDSDDSCTGCEATELGGD